MEVPALKVENEQQPVPTAWRGTFSEIVAAFAQQDYRLDNGVRGVTTVASETATQIQEYIADYGETLIPLPKTTWETSVCSWTGNGWKVLVDLWTEEEGRSDLVLHAQVNESGKGVEIEVHLVYVP